MPGERQWCREMTLGENGRIVKINRFSSWLDLKAKLLANRKIDRCGISEHWFCQYDLHFLEAIYSSFRFHVIQIAVSPYLVTENWVNVE